MSTPHIVISIQKSIFKPRHPMMALHLAIIRLMFIELWQEARARIGHADTLCVCSVYCPVGTIDGSIRIHLPAKKEKRNYKDSHWSTREREYSNTVQTWCAWQSMYRRLFMRECRFILNAFQLYSLFVCLFLISIAFGFFCLFFGTVWKWRMFGGKTASRHTAHNVAHTPFWLLAE